MTTATAPRISRISKLPNEGSAKPGHLSPASPSKKRSQSSIARLFRRSTRHFMVLWPLDTGDARRENVAMPESFSSKLAGITLPDVDNRPVRLGSLWSDSPAVVVFLRHWG